MSRVEHVASCYSYYHHFTVSPVDGISWNHIAWKVWSMTSRKRKNISTVSSLNSDARKLGKGRPDGRKLSRNKRRRHILETLEPRQLLAGPQLIGIQPNVGELIVEGSNLDIASSVDAQV